MVKDILIVGNGLSALFLSKQCLQGGMSFDVIGKERDFMASRVSGGVYNPVVAKRLVGVWNAEEQITFLNKELDEIRQITKSDSLDHPLKHYKIFSEPTELDIWKKRSQRPEIVGRINPDFPIEIKNPKINAPLGCAEIYMSGWANVPELCDLWSDFLRQEGVFVEEWLNFDALERSGEFWDYKESLYKHVVFCEGFGMKKNPYFDFLPLRGLKGETLIIRSEELPEDSIFKKDVFILPLGNMEFLVGATFDRHNLDSIPTAEGREKLIQGLEDISSCRYSVIGHRAGIRPTVKDHKPLVGQHPKYENLWVLNGLGARGLMLGASMARDLFHCIFNGMTLDPVVDIKRFCINP